MAVYFDDVKTTWYCKFRYTDWTGKSRFTTKRGFRTKKEAKLFEVDFKRGATTPNDMTVDELCTRYMETGKARKRGTTLMNLKSFIRTNISPTIGKLRLSALTPDILTKWQDSILAGFSDGTARNKNTQLSSILNYAVRMGWMERNPMRLIGSIGATSKRTDFWTFDEYMRFRRALEDAPKGRGGTERWFLLLCYDVLFFSGMRIAEFLGLGRDDIGDKAIYVRRAMNQSGEESPLKNAQSKRDIPMPDSVMEEIRTYMGRMEDVPEFGMFLIGRRTLQENMKRFSDVAGLPYITLHGLRHSHASYLIRLRVPITVISKRLGHKSPKITLDTYSHMYEEDSESVADILQDNIVGQMLVKKKKST